MEYVGQTYKYYLLKGKESAIINNESSSDISVSA